MIAFSVLGGLLAIVIAAVGLAGMGLLLWGFFRLLDWVDARWGNVGVQVAVGLLAVTMIFLTGATLWK
jgi:ABC-type phosphate/phosphonate transport system permease subunit